MAMVDNRYLSNEQDSDIAKEGPDRGFMKILMVTSVTSDKMGKGMPCMFRHLKILRRMYLYI